eukprot:1342557-Rhodomonas_salina.1
MGWGGACRDSSPFFSRNALSTCSGSTDGDNSVSARPCCANHSASSRSWHHTFRSVSAGHGIAHWKENKGRADQIHAVKLILVVEVREAHEADRVDDVRSVHVRRGSPPLVHRPVPRGPLQQEADDVREVVERCEVERGQPVQVRLVDRRPREEEHLDDALEPPHHREVQRRVPSVGSRVELYLVAPPQQELDDVRQRSPVVIGRSLAVGGPVHRRPPTLRHRVRVARVLSQQQLARACVPVPNRVDDRGGF